MRYAHKSGDSVHIYESIMTDDTEITSLESLQELRECPGQRMQINDFEFLSLIGSRVIRTKVEDLGIITEAEKHKVWLFHPTLVKPTEIYKLELYDVSGQTVKVIPASYKEAIEIMDYLIAERDGIKSKEPPQKLNGFRYRLDELSDWNLSRLH